ncbi:MAG: hypothetical protein EAZ85_12035 [Bacteroidetes bacterium]|nr:MAG: hypothetical protein EAZ85_12035 [Bacteroidota bacterium]TAG87301.1 MAG: hypothetical protein EAZ20_10840 [Bacteroidota bacterium]
MSLNSPHIKNNLWEKIGTNTKKLKFFAILLSFFSFLTLCLYVYAQWKIQYYWIYSMLLSGLFLPLFIYYRRQVSQIYNKFMDEVENRQTHQASLALLPYQKKFIKIANNWTFKRIIFFVTACFLLGISGKFISKEIKIRSITKPQTIATARKIAKQNTQDFLTKIKENINKTQKKLTDVQIHKKVIEKTLSEAKNSYYQQQGNYYQSSGFLQLLYVANNKMQQFGSIAEKEEIIKSDEMIFTQVAGMKKVELDISEKETAQAESDLSNQGALLQQFNSLLSYQQKCQYKAQKGLQSDQKSMETLQKELINIQKVEQELYELICLDNLQLIQNEKNLSVSNSR